MAMNLWPHLLANPVHVYEHVGGRQWQAKLRSAGNACHTERFRDGHCTHYKALHRCLVYFNSSINSGVFVK